MKAFIVYSLDTRLPVAVGEAIKAEWARVETADKMKIRAENLIAEEVIHSDSSCQRRLIQWPTRVDADTSG